MARQAARDRTRDATESPQETAPAQEADQGRFVHGPVPEVAAGGEVTESASDRAFGDQAGKPEIDATEQAMGKAMVQRMNQANGLDGGQYDLEHGIHYSYNFESECQRYGKPELWKDEYRNGYNASGHFINPTEAGTWMDWNLKKGHSASKAIQAWLGGLTVAECYTSVKAMQLDTLRRALGNDKFDRKFGSEDKAADKAIPDERRLRISQEGTPVDEYMKSTELADRAGSGEELTEKDLDEGLVPGQWYYFYNHPKYLLKHPGGAWQGENSLYMGKNEAGERTWAGLGASNVTEDGMIEEMVRAYNAPRDAEDERDMADRRIRRADGSYFVKKYDPAEGHFADTVTRNDILKDPPYTIGGTERKGGFVPAAGVTFDTQKVKKDRDKRGG